MLWFLLLKEDFTPWEQRVGSFHVPCRLCGAPAWQVLFRMYRTSGTAMAPATPHGYQTDVCFQIRCTHCHGAAMASYPESWVPALGVPFHHEAYPPVMAIPGYAAMAFYYR